MQDTLRCAAFLAIVPFTAQCAGLPAAKPESAGMSQQRLDRVGEWLRGIVQRNEAAGFVSLVARRGKVVHHEAYGKRGLESADAMPLDALFDLASMTKPVTVAAALMLLEEGRCTLSEPISAYIPEFKDAASKPITVHHLFTHTSGVQETRGRAQTFTFPTLADYIKDFAKLPLRSSPGAAWVYGSSHDLLGYLVERVSKMPLDRFVQERILAPLEMTDTHYWPPASKDARRAILVVNGKDDPQSLSRVPPEAARARSFIGGGSGLYSTAADYWRFAQMLANGGTLNGKRLLGSRTIAWMAKNHIGDLAFPTPGTRFGLGVAVVADPGLSGLPYSKGSYYWSGSQGTIFWIDPTEDLVGVLMVQLTPSRLRLRERFAALVYSSIIE